MYPSITVLFAALVLAASPALAQSTTPIDIITYDHDAPLVGYVVRWHTEGRVGTYVNTHGHVGSYFYTVGVPEIANRCTAPCRTTLPVGRVTLSLDDGHSRLLTSSVLIRPGDGLRVHVERQTGERVIGSLLFALPLVGAGALSAYIGLRSMDDANHGRSPFNLVDSTEEILQWAAVGGMTLFSLVVGMPLMLLSDHTDVTVIPGGIAF